MKTNLSFWSVSNIGMFLSALMLLSCSGPKEKNISGSLNFPEKPEPRKYLCYKSEAPVIPDGVLDEKAWSEVPWTDYFVDIEGSSRPVPALKTHAKMLWDDSSLYIAAELEEPHVWAYLRQRDTIVFFDNDFEVFIDPDGDTHNYYELEVNALGTQWDLLLIKPYRDGGPPLTGWDIAGLEVGIHIDGTVNDPRDLDKGWTVEMKIPLAALKECAGSAGLPDNGEQWRLGFSRVEWRTKIENGVYRKEINPSTGRPFPEDNWVWSPQGRINMHMPEMWGIVQFSSVVAGKGTDQFTDDPDLDRKWALRQVYYAETEYFNRNKSYSSSLQDLGLKVNDFPEGIQIPVIEVTRSSYESYIPSSDGKNTWTIYKNGKLVMLTDSLTIK